MGTREIAIARSVFERIGAMFPALVADLDLSPKYTELSMDFPAQPGLCFEVSLYLSNVDELHIQASSFWVEWFPCTKAKVVDDYFEAVTGLISGRFRILEHWRGSRAVKAELQRPSDDGWLTIATRRMLTFAWGKKTLRVVQNSGESEVQI